MPSRNNALPPQHTCEFCGRDILRSEKDVYFQIRGWSRVTAKGKLDGFTVLHEVLGGTACPDCIRLRRSRQDGQPDLSLF